MAKKDSGRVRLRDVAKALKPSSLAAANKSQKEGRLSTTSLDATGLGAAISAARSSTRGGDAGTYMTGTAKQQNEDRKKYGLRAQARASRASRKKGHTA